MYTVEDALELIADLHGLPARFVQIDKDMPWKIRFLASVGKYTARNSPLSIAQSAIILRMLKEEDGDELVSDGVCSRSQIDNLINHPRYRNPPFVSKQVPREVRYAGNNLLVFRFKMNDQIVTDIKNLSNTGRTTVSRSWFDAEFRVWMVPVLHSSLANIKQLISKHQFDFDEEVAQYLTDATNALDSPPMFILAEHSNMIAAYIPDNDIIAWWTKNVLEGEIV